MFRLANLPFEDVPELEKLATFCITETIKKNLEDYFERDYNKCSCGDLFSKVKIEKAREIFPEKILDEIESLGINSNLFIAKKVAQFMNILTDDDEITPDIFVEYILYKMIKFYRYQYNFDFVVATVSEYIPILKKMIREYAKEYLELTVVKERNRYVKDSVNALSLFSYLLSNDESDFTFWDFDFTFFDDWGFKNTLYQAAYGYFGQVGGYNINYVSSIFTSINEPVPSFLSK